jgi:hypothetical protein
MSQEQVEGQLLPVWLEEQHVLEPNHDCHLQHDILFESEQIQQHVIENLQNIQLFHR